MNPKPLKQISHAPSKIINQNAGSGVWREKIKNPKPETRNPKLEQEAKPETRNPKPETRNPKPETRNPKHEQEAAYGERTAFLDVTARLAEHIAEDGSIAVSCRHFFKLTNTDPLAAWFVVTGDGIRVVRSVLGAIGSLPIVAFGNSSLAWPDEQRSWT